VKLKMSLRERSITVKQLPEVCRDRQRAIFFSEIKSCLDVDRPCLVLDCSRFVRTDKEAVFLLLCCLEEAMKRNGDVRLSGVSPELRAALKVIDADLLFHFFETSADAIASFSRCSFDLSMQNAIRDAGESAA